LLEAAALLATACAFFACSAAEAPEPLMRPAALPAPALRGEAPPRSLFALVFSLDALDDSVRVGEWTAAQAQLDDALSAWTWAEPLVRDGAGSESLARAAEVELSSLRADVEDQRPLAARIGALALLESVADMVERYLSKVPPDVLRLDTELRRVRLDADIGDWDAAARDAGSAATIWARLEPDVAAVARHEATGSSAAHAVADVSKALDRVRAAVATHAEPEVVARAELAGEEVGVLRNLWMTEDVSP
jgi:hypothetical protein